MYHPHHQMTVQKVIAGVVCGSIPLPPKRISISILVLVSQFGRRLVLQDLLGKQVLQVQQAQLQVQQEHRVQPDLKLLDQLVQQAQLQAQQDLKEQLAHKAQILQLLVVLLMQAT